MMNSAINNRNIKGKSAVHRMALAALAAAALCILAPLSVPIGPVPITLSVLVVALFPYLLGAKLSVLSVALYLLIGAIGLPVFSGFEGGIQKLLGATGGYLVGYIPLVLIGGAFIEKSKKPLVQFLGLLLGLISCYALGTAWLSAYLKLSLASALSVAVLPFIPFDLIKLALAVLIGRAAGKRLTVFRDRA